MACSLNPPRLGPRVWLSNVLLPAGMFVWKDKSETKKR